jgi:TRAP-type C4-dicarboxylate transport system permease small subunit
MSGMERALKMVVALNNRIEQLCILLGATLIGFVVIALTAASAERYFFGIGLALINDLPPLLIPWLVFPMMAVLLRQHKHVAVDLLPTFLPDRRKPLHGLFVNAVVLAAAIVFFKGGREGVEFMMMLHQTTETNPRFPLWWIGVAFPAGFALLAWFALEGLLLSIMQMTGHPVEVRSTSSDDANSSSEAYK